MKTLMIGTSSMDTIEEKPKLRKIDLQKLNSLEKRSSKEKSPKTPQTWDSLSRNSQGIQKKFSHPIKTHFLDKYIKIKPIKKENFKKDNEEEFKDLKIRPIEIERFYNENMTDGNCMEFLKKSITNILNYFQEKCAELKFGENFNSIGDEKENYVFGHFVKYQFLTSLSFYFDDKLKNESNHIWDILSKIKTIEDLIFEINQLSNDYLNKDEKFSYFFCELIW